MIGLCQITKDCLNARFDQIDANQSGIETQHPKVSIHELCENAAIILATTCDIAGKQPPSPPTTPNV
jgi:hypothetical protein